MNKAMDSRHLYNANHAWKNAIFSIQNLWYRALHTSRRPYLIILQVIIGRRGCSSWRRIRSIIRLGIFGSTGQRDKCRIRIVYLVLFTIIITFTFQRIVVKRQFLALSFSDLWKHLPSHTWEKPLHFTPRLGSNALFLIFYFCFTRYGGLHCHWGWGGSAKGGAGRWSFGVRATLIKLVFPNFGGGEQNYCLLGLNFVVCQNFISVQKNVWNHSNHYTTEVWNTPKYSLNRWPSLKVHNWVIILRFFNKYLTF